MSGEPHINSASASTGTDGQGSSGTAQAGLPCHAVDERCHLGRERAHASTAPGVRARPSAPIAAVSRRHVRVSSASRFFPSGVSR